MSNRVVFLALIAVAVTGWCQDPAVTEAQASEALRRAVTFFRSDVSVEGGYLWRYSADLARREGEGAATPSMAWVQPPGTPSVGLALLAAYTDTGDSFYLDAAVESAMALVKGQLRSGGWEIPDRVRPFQAGEIRLSRGSERGGRQRYDDVGR